MDEQAKRPDLDAILGYADGLGEEARALGIEEGDE